MSFTAVSELYASDFRIWLDMYDGTVSMGAAPDWRSIANTPEQGVLEEVRIISDGSVPQEK